MNLLDMQEVLMQIHGELEDLPEGGVDLIGLDTGFNKLNELTLGLQPSMIILMGRPGMGKTTFSLNLAENISSHTPILYFSIEMTARDVVRKMLSSRSNIDLNKIRLGKMDAEEWDRLTVGFNNLMNTNITFCEETNITMDMVRNLCLDFKRENENFMVVIDYLQLLSEPREGKFSKNDQVAEISKKILSLKKEFKIPVLTLAQMNRECEKRSDPRPLASDLRESGNIEQDADIIMGIYRPALLRLEEEFEGQTYLDVLKNRQGEVGVCDLQFIGAQQRFVEYKDQEENL
jgi:replicative DNA helicase